MQIQILFHCYSLRMRKLLAITARNDDATIRKLQEIGLCAFVMKPLNFDDLFEAIERCIK